MKYILTSVLLFFTVHSALSQDYAVDQLENSPRHHEWVTIESNNRTLHNFVAYPETSEPAPVVIVIHENRGLNDWARSFADQLAEKGFIAIAPDLISNTVAGIERTSHFANSDAARQAIYSLDPEHVTADLMKVLEYARTIPSGNGQIAVTGFCWGGSQSFRFATHAKNKIDAAFVFYGTGPSEAESYSNISVPVYGFYGGNDERVNSTIDASKEAMNKYGKTFEYEIYEGAGHAYMRQGDDPDASPEDPNVIARNASWERLIILLKNL